MSTNKKAPQRANAERAKAEITGQTGSRAEKAPAPQSVKFSVRICARGKLVTAGRASA